MKNHHNIMINLLLLAHLTLTGAFSATYRPNVFSLSHIRSLSPRITSCLSNAVDDSIRGYDSTLQTELPNDFQDAANRAVDKTMNYIRSGGRRVRIDFDTSIGDVTYTSLKNTMPVLKEIVKCFSVAMGLNVSMSNISSDNTTSRSILGGGVDEIPRSIRLFFPDMGAAALTRRDWKMGTASSEVPSCVFTSNIQNDGLAASDKLIILVCPLYSEADYVLRVVQLCDQSNVPCIILNPDLINMDQGYGVRARNIRKNLLTTFVTTYKLKTLSRGAVVREWPNKYTVWKEDQQVDGGYIPLQSLASDPTREELDEMFDESDNPSSSEEKKGSAVNAMGAVKGVLEFFQGMSRL